MAHLTVGRGGTIRLDATFQDGAGTLVDPVTPLLDVVDANDLEVLTDQVPVRDALGRYHHDFEVPEDAPLGVWTAHWTGNINDVPITGDDSFEVVLAGELVFESDLRDRLERMTDASTDPVLTAADIDDLLYQSRKLDADGRAPSDTGWVPSFDLNAAASAGWMRKAGKVAPRFDATTDGAALQRAQLFSHCLEMAERFSRKVAGFVRVGLKESSVDVIGN